MSVNIDEIEQLLAAQDAELRRKLQAEQTRREEHALMQSQSQERLNEVSESLKAGLDDFKVLAEKQETGIDELVDGLKVLVTHRIEKQKHADYIVSFTDKRSALRVSERRRMSKKEKETEEGKKMKLDKRWIDEEDIPDYPCLWQDISDNTLFGRLVTSKTFDGICSIAIVLNAIFIGYSTQYAVDHYTRKEEFQKDDLILVGEWFFFAFYTMELTLKLIVWRCVFFYSTDWKWNTFDFVLVVMALYDVLIATFETGSDGSGTNLTWMRLLRLLKMVKMLRVIRVMRAFRELRLLLYSIIASLRSLLWSMMMITLVMYIFGLCFLQGVTAWLADDAKAIADNDPGHKPISQYWKGQAMEYWGSLGKSVLTCYMCVTGGIVWDPPSKVLAEVGAIYYYLFVAYIIFMLFAVFNVFTGLFVERAVQVAHVDKPHVAKEEEEWEASNLFQVKHLMETLEKVKGEGVSRQDFDKVLSDETGFWIFHSAGIKPQDAANLFRVLSGHYTHKVHPEVFMDGCTKIKGQASSVQMLALMFKTKQYMSLLPLLMNYVEECFNDMQQMWETQGVPKSTVRPLSLRLEEADTMSTAEQKRRPSGKSSGMRRGRTAMVPAPAGQANEGAPQDQAPPLQPFNKPASNRSSKSDDSVFVDATGPAPSTIGVVQEE